jgi:COP9 signalosome complex subunit 4
MFLDHILRSAEIKEFERTLKPHQLAKVSISSNDRLASSSNDDSYNDDNEPATSTRTGPSTVLDRAVMEHNLLASSKVYNNITFRGLGALLDLTPGAAENMARKMIEQGRLRGTIDQVDKLIWFESDREEDDAQGKAGGLGEVEDAEDTGAPFTKRWDAQIRLTAANVSNPKVFGVSSTQFPMHTGGVNSAEPDRKRARSHHCFGGIEKQIHLVVRVVRLHCNIHTLMIKCAWWIKVRNNCT